jgi:hypothetical protein
MGEGAVFDDVLINEPLTHPCVKGFLLHKKGTFHLEMFPFEINELYGKRR